MPLSHVIVQGTKKIFKTKIKTATPFELSIKCVNSLLDDFIFLFVFVLNFFLLLFYDCNSFLCLCFFLAYNDSFVMRLPVSLYMLQATATLVNICVGYSKYWRIFVCSIASYFSSSFCFCFYFSHDKSVHCICQFLRKQ